MVGRRDDSRALDDLVEAVRGGLSRSLVIVEAGARGGDHRAAQAPAGCAASFGAGLSKQRPVGGPVSVPACGSAGRRNAADFRVITGSRVR
jgi:hypothetical protein